MRVWGLWSRVWGLGFGVSGFGFRLWFRVSDFGFRVSGFGFSQGGSWKKPEAGREGRERARVVAGLQRVDLVHRRNVKWFRGGLVFKAHRLLYHSTLGWGVIKKKKKWRSGFGVWGSGFIVLGVGFGMQGSEAGSHLRLIDFCITQL